MIQFGMPTLIELSGIEACAALANELSLRFVELNMNQPQFQPPQIDAERYRALSNQYGVYFTIHLDENFNPFDFNQRVADAYLQSMRETIGIARQIGAPLINIHLPYGVYFKLPNEKRYLFDTYNDEYLQRVREFRQMCEQEIGNTELTVCIENTDGFDLPFLRRTLGILLQSDVFALTYDTGHDHCAGQADLPFYLENQNKLRHMHLHDGLAQSNHLPLGTGEIDILRFIALARAQNCRTVLEVKTVDGLKQSVTWLIKKGLL